MARDVVASATRDAGDIRCEVGIAPVFSWSRAWERAAPNDFEPSIAMRSGAGICSTTDLSFAATNIQLGLPRHAGVVMTALRLEMYSPPRLTSSLKPESYSIAGSSFSQSCSLSIHSRTYAGQFSSLTPSASQPRRNLSAITLFANGAIMLFANGGNAVPHSQRPALRPTPVRRNREIAAHSESPQPSPHSRPRPAHASGHP